MIEEDLKLLMNKVLEHEQRITKLESLLLRSIGGTQLSSIQPVRVERLGDLTQASQSSSTPKQEAAAAPTSQQQAKKAARKPEKRSIKGFLKFLTKGMKVPKNFGGPFDG